MVRPYDVSEPLLFGDVDQDVMAFARAKFASLAKGAISRMQRWEASGIFEGEADGLRSLWDEWCWYQANHSSDTPLLSDAIEQTLDELIETVVSELSKTEAVLLTKAADPEAPDVQRFAQHITLSNAMVSLCTKVGIFRFDQMLLEFAETMGLTKSDVEQRYGRPNERRAPVGEPPISRWLYDDYSVYFEHDLVIESVLNHGAVLSSGRQPND